MKMRDVIVIGAGHAGIEAALAAARMGCDTALLTMNNDHIGYMSCNPAIGGQAKGQLAREVDALGGQMGINTDKSALQYKRLNMSKGPAVRSSRAQCDKVLYSLNMKKTVESQPGLETIQREVVDIKIRNGRVHSVVTNFGEEIPTKAVIVTAGTFLKAVMHCGQSQQAGGRAGDNASNELSQTLKNAGFELTRLKTGTPARLQKKSINFSVLQEEWGDQDPLAFSFFHRIHPFPYLEQQPCYLTYTNPEVHEIIEKYKDVSPMFTGQITGRGPRYCPSIEDKVFRFAEKDRHQVFLEPESLYSEEIYANGLSTSLPLEAQEKFLRKINGLESVVIARPGYAVEYDAIVATCLRHTMEAKEIRGLYFAGQVNGTSGYEEAAAQGLIAGVNAASQVQDKPEFVLGRSEAYIGVLIDDLVTKGCDEPYRMFTSRAEYRLLLREETADARLTEKSWNLGLLPQDKYDFFRAKMECRDQIESSLQKTYFYKKNQEQVEKLAQIGVASVPDRISAHELLKRPEAKITKLIEMNLFSILGLKQAPENWVLDRILEEIEVCQRYEGYISREIAAIERLQKQENKRIPDSFSYKVVKGLSNEVKERLERVRPETLGQLHRISGITPAAAALVFIHLERGSISSANQPRT